MNDPSLHLPLTDIQRDRAVEYLQRVYASGGIDDFDFETRLGQALTARNRAELNDSLKGLARVAPAIVPVTDEPTGGNDGPANIMAGIMHLAAMPSLMIVSAIGRGLARPGSRVALEAGRAMCFQFSAVIYGIVAIILGALRLLPGEVIFAGAMTWVAVTFWLALRAFSGEKSTTYVEWMMLTRPREDRKPQRIR